MGGAWTRQSLVLQLWSGEGGAMRKPSFWQFLRGELTSDFVSQDEDLNEQKLELVYNFLLVPFQLERVRRPRRAFSSLAQLLTCAGAVLRLLAVLRLVSLRVLVPARARARGRRAVPLEAPEEGLLVTDAQGADLRHLPSDHHCVLLRCAPHVRHVSGLSLDSPAADHQALHRIQCPRGPPSRTSNSLLSLSLLHTHSLTCMLSLLT